MKSLQRSLVWNPVIFICLLLLLISFISSYLIEKKNTSLSLSTIEYIRDTKYKSLNKDNLQSAFDFTSLNYSSYILDEKGIPLFSVNYRTAPEVIDLCKITESSATKIFKLNNVDKVVSIRKNGQLCLVVEGNTNNSVLLGSFAQNIFYGQILLILTILYLLAWLQFQKVYRSIKLVVENNENALVSKWENIKKGSSKITELENLEKYSGYVLEMLRQSRGLSNTEKALEIKEVQTKYVTKRAEYDISKFKLGLDNSPNYICIVDQHGYIGYINKEITNTLGYRIEEAENKRVVDLWHKDSDENMTPDTWKQKYDEAAKEKKSTKFNTFGFRKNGIKYESAVVITPIQNEQNIVENFLVVERDVTEEKQKERIKSEFISVVSHELRTPMTVIRGYSSLLSDGTLGELNEKQKEYVARINSETGRLLDLANDMLDMQKFDSGKIELKFEKKNVLELVEHVVNSYQDPFAKKGLTLKIENNIKDANLTYALVDPKYFERTISNLLSNANKYTEKGGVQVFLLNPDEDHIVVAVKDTGVGVSEAAIPHLFERFFQADGVMARKKEGSGLGLSIVKTIVEAHHGMCWVESKKDVGSTFYIALPVEK
jgi:PAS domain S-box-containing protein